jgi:hypothetical protein
MTHPDPEWITTILVTFLEGNTVGLDVGLGEAPESPSPAYPYLVVVPLGAEVDGSLNSVNEIQVMDWQVTSVGLTAQQALGGSAAARDRMLGSTEIDFSAASYKKTGAVKLPPPGPQLESEQADKPSLFLSVETYRMTLVPA